MRLLVEGDGVEGGGVDIGIVAEESLKTPCNTSLGGSKTTVAVQDFHLVLVAATESVEVFQLVDRHAGVVVPAVTAHVVPLLFLDVV